MATIAQRNDKGIFKPAGVSAVPAKEEVIAEPRFRSGPEGASAGASMRSFPKSAVQQVREICLHYVEKTSGKYMNNKAAARYIHQMAEEVMNQLSGVSAQIKRHENEPAAFQALIDEWNEAFPKSLHAIGSPKAIAALVKKQEAEIVELRTNLDRERNNRDKDVGDVLKSMDAQLQTSRNGIISERRQLAKIQQQETERFQYLIAEEKRKGDLRVMEIEKKTSSEMKKLKSDTKAVLDGESDRLRALETEFAKEKMEIKKEISAQKKMFATERNELKTEVKDHKDEIKRLKKQIDALMSVSNDVAEDEAFEEEEEEESEEEEEEEEEESEEEDFDDADESEEEEEDEEEEEEEEEEESEEDESEEEEEVEELTDDDGIFGDLTAAKAERAMQRTVRTQEKHFARMERKMQKEDEKHKKKERKMEERAARLRAKTERIAAKRAAKEARKMQAVVDKQRRADEKAAAKARKAEEKAEKKRAAHHARMERAAARQRAQMEKSMRGVGANSAAAGARGVEEFKRQIGSLRKTIDDLKDELDGRQIELATTLNEKALITKQLEAQKGIVESMRQAIGVQMVSDGVRLDDAMTKYSKAPVVLHHTPHMLGKRDKSGIHRNVAQERRSSYRSAGRF